MLKLYIFYGNTYIIWQRFYYATHFYNLCGKFGLIQKVICKFIGETFITHKFIVR